MLCWIEGYRFDSRGVGHWYPLYCYDSIRKCEWWLRLILRDRDEGHARSTQPELALVKEFRIRPSADHELLMEHYRDHKRANKGICPNCGKKKTESGHALNRRALRCLKCSHVWCIVIPNIKPPKQEPIREETGRRRR